MQLSSLSKIIRLVLKIFQAKKTSCFIRHWDILLVVSISPVVVVLTSFIFNERIDAYDEGIHFLNYAMFKTGKIPYIDYYPLFPPIWTYSQIAVEYLLGDMLIIQRLWFVAQGVLLIFVCYIFLREIVSAKSLALGTLCMVIIFGLDPFWLPRWSGVRLAIYILFFVSYWRYSTSPKQWKQWWRFFLGLYIGASNLYAFDVGIHLTITGIFIVILSMLKAPNIFERKSAIALSFGGFICPLLIWAAYLQYHGVLGSYVVTYYYLYMVLLMPISAKILSAGHVPLSNYRIGMLALFLAVLAAGLIYQIGYKGIIKKEYDDLNLVLITAMFMSFIVSASTLRGIQGPQYAMFALIPMLFWLGFLFDRLKRFALERTTVFSRLHSRLALDFFLLAPLAIFNTLLFKGEVFAKYNAFKTAVALTRSLNNDYGLREIKYRPTTLKWQLDTQFDSITNYLYTHTRTDESILAFPMYVEIIPALARRNYATHYPIPILMMGSPKDQLAYIAEIEKEKPRYIVFFPEAKFGGLAPVKPFFGEVYKYIYTFYRPVYDFPLGLNQQVWIRRIYE